MSEIKSFVYTNSEDPAEPSLYIKEQEIGTGRSETALIVASQILIFRVFFFLIFEQTSRNLALSDSKTVDLVV